MNIDGIITPMVTPLLGDDKIDLKGLETLIEHLIKGKVHGIFILGTSGEAQSLGYDSKVLVIEYTLKIVNNRIPVYVGVSDTSLYDSVHLSSIAEKNGASAVVATTPYYFKPTQADLMSYYVKLADSINIPLIVYNMPSHTKVDIDAQTLVALADHDNIVGYKDSSGNLKQFQEVIKDVRDKDFSFLCGPEEILSFSLIAGGNGGVPGGSNILPNLFVELYESYQAHDLARMLEINNIIYELSKKVYNLGYGNSGYLQGVKSALKSLGIISSNHLNTPYTGMGDELQKTLGQDLKDLMKKHSLNI